MIAIDNTRFLAPINNSTPIKDETQQNWNLSTNSNVIISSTSNSNTAIISQEEQSDFQGYVGYVGSASVSTNLNGSKAVTYAQEEPSTYGPIYGQQIFGERISGLTYSQEYVYPTLQVICNYPKFFCFFYKANLYYICLIHLLILLLDFKNFNLKVIFLKNFILDVSICLCPRRSG